MGELHLDVIVRRVVDDYKVDARVGKPQVSYRESVSAAIEHRERFHRAIAGKENAADITIRVEPLERGGGNRFASALASDALPKTYGGRGARNRGAFQSGTLYGYPVIDVGVTLLAAE